MTSAQRNLRLGVFVLVVAVLALAACTGKPQPPDATLPILLTDQVNPPGPHAGTGWAAGVCGGHAWLWDKGVHLSPRYEWTPVLGDESEPQIVASSGWAVKSGLSSQDVPFTHIFIPVPGSAPRWGDAEFMIAPDSSYQSLLVNGNLNTTNPASEFFQGWLEANEIKGADTSSGVLGVETDQYLLPGPYRPKHGDRVAVFGRWIVDCGHTDFHAEIHPPLLTARAWNTNNFSQCGNDSAPNVNGVPFGSVTCMRVIGRPYLDSQEFGDGSLPTHIIKELGKVACPGVPLPCIFQMSAIAHVLPKPFSDLQLMTLDVRPPPSHVPGDQLIVQYHFTVRPGVAVLLTRTGTDGVRVYVIMRADQYTQPQPKCHIVKIDPYLVSKAFDPTTGISFGTVINVVFPGLFGSDPIRTAVLNRGIEAKFCDAPAAVSKSDTAIHQVLYDSVGQNRPEFSVDKSQPFPVYGFLNIGWAHPLEVIPSKVIITSPTDGETFGPAPGQATGQPLRTGPISFAATTVGLPSSSLKWTDNGRPLGNSSSFTSTLSAGSCGFETHIIEASGTDDTGNLVSAKVAVETGQIC